MTELKIQRYIYETPDWSVDAFAKGDVMYRRLGVWKAEPPKGKRRTSETIIGRATRDIRAFEIVTIDDVEITSDQP